MITYAADNQKQNVIDSWKIAFPNDSDAFVEFYFEKKYRNEDTLLYFKNNNMAASLQMLPYKMTYYQHFINTSYISGAMTLPQYRNQGLMGNLLVHSFREMKKRKDILTTLIPQEPWLIDFYKKFGYTPCFEYKLTAINPNDYPHFPDKIHFKEIQPADLTAAHLFYKNHFARQNLCIQKSFIDFSTMVAECQLFERNVYVLIDKEEVVGLCFCFFTNEKIVLKDCIAKNENYRQYFFSKLIQKFDNQSVFLYSPVSCSVFPYSEISSTQGMARIIDAPKLLQLFAQTYSDLAFSVKINDEYILENNVTLSVSKGEVTHIISPIVDFELSIEELTQLLLGYHVSLLDEKYAVFPEQHPYMSLMLE